MSNEYPYASMRDSFDLSAYFVVGPEDCKGRPLTDVVDQALHGGATFIQLRAKEADASELTDMARDIAQIIEDNEKSDSVAFVIDDRADVVWQARRKGIKVDGVHIGQTDMEPREARALLGDEAIVVCRLRPKASFGSSTSCPTAASTTLAPVLCTSPPPSPRLPWAATTAPARRWTPPRSTPSALPANSRWSWAAA